MARILITSGPTRQYLDPVRFLSNASSGRMGRALAEAAIEQGHDVVLVSGPVEVAYPTRAELVRVVSTEELLAACLEHFPRCDGLVAVAAPCDYRPTGTAPEKLSKTGQNLVIELVETPDVVARLASIRQGQWMGAFALETQDERIRAMQKLERKACDLIVVNGPAAMEATDTAVEVLDRQGRVLAAARGAKDDVARAVFSVITQQLIEPAGQT